MGRLESEEKQFGTQLNGKKNQNAGLESISAQKWNCKRNPEWNE